MSSRKVRVHVCAPAVVSGAHRTEWQACSLINKHIKHIRCGRSSAGHQKWESVTSCSLGFLLKSGTGVFKANTFIEIEFTNYKVHLFHVYNFKFFGKFTEMCNHHHNLVLGHFYPPKRKSYTYWQSLPSPPPVTQP